MDTRKLDPAAIIVFHQACVSLLVSEPRTDSCGSDVGEYLRDEVRFTPDKRDELLFMNRAGHPILVLDHVLPSLLHHCCQFAIDFLHILRHARLRHPAQHPA